MNIKTEILHEQKEPLLMHTLAISIRFKNMEEFMMIGGVPVVDLHVVEAKRLDQAAAVSKISIPGIFNFIKS